MHTSIHMTAHGVRIVPIKIFYVNRLLTQVFIPAEQLKPQPCPAVKSIAQRRHDKVSQYRLQS